MLDQLLIDVKNWKPATFTKEQQLEYIDYNCAQRFPDDFQAIYNSLVTIDSAAWMGSEFNNES